MDPAVLANLTMLNQQMSNSSMWQNMTTQSRQNMLFNFMMLNGPMFNNSPMWQNSTLTSNRGMLGSMFTLENMQGVLSMLQNLTMLNSQMLNNLAVLNPERLGNLNLTNQQMLENLSKLNPEMLANLINLNPRLLGNLGTFGNMPFTNRRRRQVVVPISLPTTGGLVDAITTPVEDELDNYMPTLMKLINMTNLNNTICLQNMNNESRCYVFGVPEAGNFDLRTTTFAIFFMREHNRLARALYKLNPCWKDDRLFKVARQINIATAQNILMYELLPKILGYKNMLKYGLISEHVQYVTAYDESAVPLVYAEFEIAIRYFHTMLDGRIKLYDEKYHYDREFSVSNTTFRQSLIEQDKNFEKINRGTFYQQAARIDDIQDPEISEKYYGDLQRAADLPSLDIQRGRDLGVRGYNDYRHICGMKPARKFEDFEDVMDREVFLLDSVNILAKDTGEWVPHFPQSGSMECTPSILRITDCSLGSCKTTQLQYRSFQLLCNMTSHIFVQV
ncbi:myeloperoxidase-like [Cydia pomonella]|uniref:myeloperoxidase-like n=1 Tax=Cydia pomonella TaxID=82600 RepID=UPI002ADE7D8A|nr:myeloperoxidase-like [Cydia pomonella]